MLDELTPSTSPVDYFLGVRPKFSEHLSIRTRIDSFDVDIWRQQSISSAGSPHLTLESFASAGLFYTGNADNIMCYWCGLGLNHSDRTRAVHASFCTWLLRTMASVAATESRNSPQQFQTPQQEFEIPLIISFFAMHTHFRLDG